jgi:hypothetical protein
MRNERSALVFSAGDRTSVMQKLRMPDQNIRWLRVKAHLLQLSIGETERPDTVRARIMDQRTISLDDGVNRDLAGGHHAGR